MFFNFTRQPAPAPPSTNRPRPAFPELANPRRPPTNRLTFPDLGTPCIPARLLPTLETRDAGGVCENINWSTYFNLTWHRSGVISGTAGHRVRHAGIINTLATQLPYLRVHFGAGRESPQINTSSQAPPASKRTVAERRGADDGAKRFGVQVDLLTTLCLPIPQTSPFLSFRHPRPAPLRPPQPHRRRIY